MDTQSHAHKRRILSVFSLVMINIIAVDSLRTLPISAEYGFSLVFFYIIGALFFFLPVAFVSAELATGWPTRGGLYIWVREAFGKRWGFFTIWLQWIYNVVWYPTILAFIAAAIAYLFDPSIANNKIYLLCSINIMFWLATLINCLGMRASSLTSTIGALVGTLIPMLFIIGLGIAWLSTGKPSQINFDWPSFIPDLSHINNLVFFIAILFSLIGMEMSAVHAEEVKNPQRDYPKALFYSTIIILATLTLSSLAIAIVVPQKELSLVSGLLDAFAIFFTAFNLPWMKPIVAILIIIGGFTSVSTWLIGPTKGLMAAAKDGNMPAIFAKMNRHEAPYALLILQGFLFSLLSSVFVLLPTVNSSYWMLSALTAQLALIVYILMFAAIVRLRYSQPNVHRSYTIPGGKKVVWTIAIVGSLTCIAAIFLGFLPPKQISVDGIFRYELLLISGMILLSLPPFLLKGKKSKVGK